MLTNKLQHKYSWLIAAILIGLILAACGRTAEPGAADLPPTPLPTVDVDLAATVAANEDLKTYTVVPEESEAAYIVNEEFFEDALSKLGINPGEAVVRGVTGGVSGALTLNTADLPASPLGTLTVDLTQLQTDQRQRDRWIQEDGPQFQRFPTAVFVATGLDSVPQRVTDGEAVQFQLSGDLTVRGVTRPTTFDVTAEIDGDRLIGTARTELLISDFGIEPPSFFRTLTVADPFAIEVALTAIAE